MTMTLNLPAGFYQASLHFAGVGLPTGAAITFAGDQGGAGPTPAAIAATIIAAWGTHVDSVTSNSVTFTGVRVKEGPMDTGSFADVSATNVGGGATTMVAPQIAYLVRKITGMGGKKGTGRMYVPGLGDAAVDPDGTIASATLTNLETAWDNFFGALGTANIGMVLAHSFGTFVNGSGETVTVPAIPPTPVTSLTVDSRIVTQRRRNRR